MNVVSPVQAPEAVAESISASRAKKLGPFQWDDALLLEGQLTEDERAIRDAARTFPAPSVRRSCSPASSKPTATSASTARS